MFWQKGDIFIGSEDTLDIYVIGYKKLGESIIVNLADQFLGVIDCYKKNELFITKDILEELGVQQLDFLCWTHPHDDHTKGLAELFSYVSKEETVFLLPEGISYREIYSTFIDDSRYKEYEDIFRLIQEELNSFLIVSANHSSTIYDFNLVLKDTPNIYRFNLQAFAPLSEMARKNSLISIQDILEENKKSHEQINDYSIGLKLNITGNNKNISVCLSGDIDNDTIQEMPKSFKDYVFGQNTILKIPHHCSLRSNELLTSGSIKYFDHAVTTSYKRGSNLPNSELLESYKEFGVVSRTDDGEDDFGYVLYKIPIGSLFPKKIEVMHYGAANIC